MSKGSKRRPGDELGYRVGYDRIFGERQRFVHRAPWKVAGIPAFVSYDVPKGEIVFRSVVGGKAFEHRITGVAPTEGE